MTQELTYLEKIAQNKCGICGGKIPYIITQSGTIITEEQYKQIRQEALTSMKEVSPPHVEQGKICSICLYEKRVAKLGYEKFTLDNFGKLGEKQAIVASEIKRDIGKNKKGNIILGGSQKGKTALLYAYYREIILRENYLVGNFVVSKDKIPIRNIEIGNIFEVINKDKNTKVENGKTAWEILLNKKYVFIDDLGIERVTDDLLERLMWLVITRIDNDLLTVITTDLTIEELIQKYNKKLITKMGANFPIHTL